MLFNYVCSRSSPSTGLIPLHTTEAPKLCRANFYCLMRKGSHPRLSFLSLRTGDLSFNPSQYIINLWHECLLTFGWGVRCMNIWTLLSLTSKLPENKNGITVSIKAPVLFLFVPSNYPQAYILRDAKFWKVSPPFSSRVHNLQVRGELSSESFFLSQKWKVAAPLLVDFLVRLIDKAAKKIWQGRKVLDLSGEHRIRVGYLKGDKCPLQREFTSLPTK